MAVITLKKPLDFETRPSYILSIKAKDSSTVHPLTAFATVAINVIDIQDQPPVFINAPYSATIPENSPEGTSVMTIIAIDGDTGNPRPIALSLVNELFGHFKLQPIGNPEDGKAILLTTNIQLDREKKAILQNGGVYTFSVKATEFINNEIPADSTISQITIVLTDVDDHIPVFNEPNFEISIPENLEQDTPLPGLSIFVIDEDLGSNSRYELSLRNVKNSEGVFDVFPTQGEGKTPIVVKIMDSSKLDYDVADKDLTVLIFDLIASVNGTDLGSTRITVRLQDSNDNSPIFSQQSYHLNVEENSKIGLSIAEISATDNDSGNYSKLIYKIKGFGSDYFYTNKNLGGVFVGQNLDYEKQNSYSLTLVAVDGGGRETNANLYINVLDVNDNAPMFESLEYTRTIREDATEFEPQFFVRATDADGPTQGDGKVTYKIESENSISGHVFSIDENSGEIKIREPVSSMDTERGQYELMISATDYSKKSLKNDTRVLIRVGLSGNQRPIFKGHFSSVTTSAIPGPPNYRVTIPENAVAGYNVTTVMASDPDGSDSLLRYRIIGAGDNFDIDDVSGLVTVSTYARLDRDSNPDSYSIIVNAVDAGFPIAETATATINIKIQDVNDKPPKFNQPSYTAYVSERTEIGAEVIRVSAKDTDVDSKIKYTIIDPIKAASKAGVQITTVTSFDFKSVFKIDSESGKISVNNTLDHNSAAVIILTVEARDLNAHYFKEKQFATTEVTLYIQSFKDTNPVFKHKDWVSTNPYIQVNVKEELPIDKPIFTLIAEDPITHQKISSFELVNPDSYNLVSLNDRTGEVILKKRLDYENLNTTFIVFAVKAITSDGLRETVTNINMTVENVNDNDPIFDKKSYHGAVLESMKYPEMIVTVHATDNDIIKNDLDRKYGFNQISYSLAGQNNAQFTINNETGEIRIAPNQTLDREKYPIVRLIVIAEDSPGKPSESRKSSADVIIEILDINDNPPIFPSKSYSAVIPENAPTDTFVAVLNATDPDDGPGGEVRYDFLNEGEANGFLKINHISGEIRSKIPLTGKGRSDPYEIMIRAQDNGGQVPKQRSLYSDVTLSLYIGDVSSNDGIPFFIAPKIGQTANISENATLGSPVFQVIASDPDNPTIPSGQLKYKIQDDIEDAQTFRIDKMSGLITTVKSLDRETKSSYNIILEVSDHGEPPQAATIVLKINVMDVDDHKPRFDRLVESGPYELVVLEEQAPGIIVGNISAIDEDIGENGAIDYMFIDGNEEEIFKVIRTDTNGAVITTAKKLDREKADSYFLTIKCFKYSTKHNQVDRKAYNIYDLSELRILIKVADIDDHLPEFENKNQTVGIRQNTAVDVHVLTVKAFDEDPDAGIIRYSMKNITFIPQYNKKQFTNSKRNYSKIFNLNEETGEIKTSLFLSDFVDGYFEVVIRANNSMSSRRFTDNFIKIYIIRDKSLLKFVFTKSAVDVTNTIDDFSKKIQSELKASDLELQVFDAQILTKSDHSLDFTSTRYYLLILNNL